MSAIQEIIAAIDAEILAIKSKKRGSRVRISKRQFVQNVDNLFVYQYTLDDVINVSDDTSAELDIKGAKFKCQIVSTSGQLIQICLEEDLDKQPSVAILTINNWELLERLRERFEKSSRAKYSFAASDKLLLGEVSKIGGGPYKPSYSSSEETLNPSQHAAVESSVNDSLSIIWGPPATGKTSTIARAVESHLNLGRKVLLSSHSNNAVDQALTATAPLVKDTYYSKSQLVRLGAPKVERLKTYSQSYPLVLPNKIVDAKASTLAQEKETLQKESQSIASAVEKLNQMLPIQEKITNLDGQITQLTLAMNIDKNQVQETAEKITGLQEHVRKLHDSFTRGQQSGLLGRILMGYNPKYLDTELERAGQEISEATKQYQELENAVSEQASSLSNLQSEREKHNLELTRLASELPNSVSDIKTAISTYYTRQVQLNERMDKIKATIRELRKKTLSDARLIATTLTSACLSQEIQDLDFDTLIIDEVSMAPLPMIYLLAPKAKKSITLVGDFKQLGPIYMTKNSSVQKWFKNNIFDLLHISTKNIREKKVNLLSVQYRMHPLISGMINTSVYDGQLINHESTKEKNLIEPVAGDLPICLVDTTIHNPLCTQLQTTGRVNLFHVSVCISLIERIIQTLKPNDSIGIITPYRQQAQLILKAIEDAKFEKKVKVRVNTVHSFQGSEDSVIIFDSVESVGANKWSMLSEQSKGEEAVRLLNVAVTRAETKFFLVANKTYLESNFRPDSLLIEFLQYIQSKGRVVSSGDLLTPPKEDNFDSWNSGRLLGPFGPEPTTQVTDIEFWPSFINDILSAKEEVIIFSPFINPDRFTKLKPELQNLTTRGVKLYVLTQPTDEDSSKVKEKEKLIYELEQIGAKVSRRKDMHEKIAIIDRKVKWVGSLNILSHRSGKEYMERSQEPRLIHELFRMFKLKEIIKADSAKTQTEVIRY